MSTTEPPPPSLRLHEKTIQELRSMIKWRRKQIGDIARIASFMTGTQLEVYERYAQEIVIIEAEIKQRKEKARDISKFR